jgi:predicted ABC-type ATPase
LDVERRLKASTAEQSRLRAIVGDHEIQRERIAAEHQAAVTTLEQSLALANQEAAVSRDQTRQTLAELRSQLAEALAEQSRLATREEEHEGERDHMIAEHQRALGDLETSKLRALVGDHEIQRERIAAEHQAAVTTIEQSLALANQEAALSREQTSQTLAEVRSQLAEALVEQSRLAAREEEHEGERDRMIAEHQRALDLETRKREALVDLRSELSQALTEQRQVGARAEEEHERERVRMSAEYDLALADLETSKREALATLHSQLSQALAEQGRLTALADEDHELERHRMNAEHQRSIADLETRGRDALVQLSSQLSQTAAEERRLAARAEELERERDRMSIDHGRAIADLETRGRDALVQLSSQLSQTSSAEKSRLTERIEELDRERDLMSAEHRRAIADLQTSKADALAECEGLLTEIHQALLFRDGLAGAERRLIDTIDETEREIVECDHLAELQGSLTLAISDMQTVLAHDSALQEGLEADASVRERAERSQDEPIVGVKPRASSMEDS